MIINLSLFLPYSLVNIYKELQNDIQGFSIPKHGNLTGWAKQGICTTHPPILISEAYFMQNMNVSIFNTSKLLSWVHTCNADEM